MMTSIKQLTGIWDLGYALDKHTLSSVFLGIDDLGNSRFQTQRSEVGEALYQLKYCNSWSHAETLAEALALDLYPKFMDVGLIIPMPASKVRTRQPVTEVAMALGQRVSVPVFDRILAKKPTGQLKDLSDKARKMEALEGSLSVQDTIANEGQWNALVVDDLFDTGASLETACRALRGFRKINRLYVATLTWK
jgi:predicted amidophosphoribosyltransferase